MQPARGTFRGGVAICTVATVLLLVAIAGSRRPAHLVNSGAPPWQAPGPASVGTGIQDAGLSLLSAPGVVTRFAIHLDVRVDGTAVRVPSGIGIDWRARTVAPLYTSDNTGTVHITSDEYSPVFRLGQFFDEWQVPLHGGTVYVDGSQQQGDPGQVVLAPHQEVLVSFGKPAGKAPAGYAFPAGT
jgi:hypothetical protein